MNSSQTKEQTRAPHTDQPGLLLDRQTSWSAKMADHVKSSGCYQGAPGWPVVEGAVVINVPSFLAITVWVGAEKYAPLDASTRAVDEGPWAEPGWAYETTRHWRTHRRSAARAGRVDTSFAPAPHCRYGCAHATQHSVHPPDRRRDDLY